MEAKGQTAIAVIRDAIECSRIDRAVFTDDARWQLVGTFELPIGAYIADLRCCARAK